MGLRRRRRRQPVQPHRALQDLRRRDLEDRQRAARSTASIRAGSARVTITKSITIKCQYTEGGVLVSGTNAIVINAANTDTITLRGLDINGIGTGRSDVAGRRQGPERGPREPVRQRDLPVQGRRRGGSDRAGVETKTVLKRNHIHDNDLGVINAPGSNTIGFTTMVMRDNDIQQNGCGVTVSAFGTNASTPTTTDSAPPAPPPGSTSPRRRTSCGTASTPNLGTPGFGLLARGASARVETRLQRRDEQHPRPEATRRRAHPGHHAGHEPGQQQRRERRDERQPDPRQARLEALID